MAKSEYIILRRKPETRLLNGQADRMDARTISGNKRQEPLANALTVSTLETDDADDMRRDPDVLLARRIPLALIRPLAASREEEDKALQLAFADKVSWGVHEVAPNAAIDAGSVTTVAVLDTGIEANHSAFRGVNLITENFSDSPANGDILGHGTHCAGTIFGRDVDGVRIGIARGVRNALIGKVLNDRGGGDTARFARAMQWAVDNGARVISMSLGFDFHTLFIDLESEGYPRAQAFSMALSHHRDTVRLFDGIIKTLNATGVLLRHGTAVVAAAGNESLRNGTPPSVVDVSLPASANDVVSVGAIQKGESGFEIAHFSNANPRLWAPGVGIVSAKIGGGLAVSQGTSMATPHVAGAAVLWSEWLARRNPRPGPEELTGRLVAGARLAGFSRTVAKFERGNGLVQAPPI
jgi:subtilisin family serine protease